MALQINDPSVHAAVKQLAKLTGEYESQTVAVAVNERLARLQQDDLAARLLDIGHETARTMAPATKRRDHAEPLYDDDGLPA